MSSTSLLDSLQAYEGRTSFPFPDVHSQRPRSPSNGSDNTPPYISRTLPSEHSGTSSRHYRRERSDRDSDSRKERDSQSSSARILSRISSRSDRDTRHLRTLLVIANDRLESETKRADQAEQRVVDVLHRLKAANDATAVARAQTSRVEQELNLYKIYYEEARREIQRAQDDVAQIERARVDAETEAARARDTARKCRERLVLSQAMEQGRQQGYAEGLERGRRMFMAQSQAPEPARQTPLRSVTPLSAAPPSRMYHPASVEDVEDDDDEELEDRYEPRPASASVPSVHRVSPLPQPIPYRPPEQIRIVPSRPPSRKHDRVPDFAPIAETLPIPTVATPLNAPSVAHVRPPPPESPSPPPVPVPPRARSEDPVPIPIHEAPPSPVHPPYIEAPDVLIPYAKDNDVASIELPPPHEFSRPLSPASPSPRLSEAPLPIPDRSAAPATPRAEPRQDRRYEPSVRSRDYAFANAPPVSFKAPPASSMRSPQSRTSTRISEYDIVAPPKVYRQGVDRETLSGRQQIYRESPATTSSRGREQAPPQERFYAGAGPADSPADSPASSQRRRGTSSTRSTLQKLFGRKRSKSRLSQDDAAHEHSVPEIEVESPSDVSPPSSQNASAPHLLSPEHAHTALPTLAQALGTPHRTYAPPAVPETQAYAARAPSGPGTPSRRGYVEAPVPSSVVYPEAPGRTRSRASVTRPGTAQSGSTVDSQSLRSRRRQGSLADNRSGRLSPLSSIGIPFTSFAASSEGR
ncbi:hypothetical protein PsYK624_092600 [Phanerochaete sordida]|uniref:Uncharacterized protein n=1 Tax=Phanerochaete sordida TaxID=48140 RepID=A0A9P3LF13_9APHY|nr:hypothetical protein PsYK624_092600 [Phanerochaete sordida]